MIDLRRSALALALLVPGLAVTGCGPGGGTSDDDVDAPVIDGAIRTPGGGVASPGISGALNVFAVDAVTDAPISGATVQVEAATPLVGTTNGDGLVKLADAALTGPQTVTVTASGHVATTWIAVGGHDVTIPLAPASSAVATAHVSGTIAGWDSLPAPPFGHYTLGVIVTSFTDDIGGPENNITQPAPGGTPANTCLNTGLSSSCAWQLESRTGRQVHFAVIVDGDPNGTTSDVSDDDYTLIGYAIGSSVTLAAGQTMSGESLTLVDAGQLTNLSLTLPGAPAGLTDVVAIPMLDLGDDGRLPFPLPTLTPANRMTRVINPSGRFSGTYDLVALASPPGAAATPYATTITRGLSSVAGINAPAWLAPPTGVTLSGASGSFTAPASPIRYATVRQGTSARWTLAILDGSSTFTLPALASDPLPGGTLSLEITAADVPSFDAGNFRVTDLRDHLARASGATASFSH